MTKKIILDFKGGLGDAVVFAGCVADFQKCNPNVAFKIKMLQYDIFGALQLADFDNDDPQAETFSIQASFPCDERGYHLRLYLNMEIQRKTGLPFHFSTVRAPLPENFNVENPVCSKVQFKGNYWILNAGINSQFELKDWGTENYQSVVDALRGKIQFVQVGRLGKIDRHQQIEGALSLLGNTSDTELLRAVKESGGVLGPVSGLVHIAGAYRVPAVVICGGREAPEVSHYPGHRTFDTIGLLPCCKDGPCDRWALADCKNYSKYGLHPQKTVPRCMELIRPEMVINEILQIENEAKA